MAPSDPAILARDEIDRVAGRAALIVVLGTMFGIVLGIVGLFLGGTQAGTGLAICGGCMVLIFLLAGMFGPLADALRAKSIRVLDCRVVGFPPLRHLRDVPTVVLDVDSAWDIYRDGQATEVEWLTGHQQFSISLMFDPPAPGTRLVALVSAARQGRAATVWELMLPSPTD
ncbi:MAG: hypothetical protein AB7S36_21385 [Planctomycetota bacterium]